MTNLLKADFRRVWKDKMLIVMGSLAVVFAMITPILYTVILSTTGTDENEMVSGMISNLLTGCLPTDVLFGSLATLLGAFGGWLLRKRPYLAPLPTVIANTVIVPFVLAWAYRVEEGLPFLFLTVGVGELLSAYALGVLLYTVLKRNRLNLFENKE